MLIFVNFLEKVIAISFSLAAAQIFDQDQFGLLNYMISLAMLVAVFLAYGTQGVYFRESATLDTSGKNIWKVNIIAWYALSIFFVYVAVTLFKKSAADLDLSYLPLVYATVIVSYVANLFVTDALYSGRHKNVYLAYISKLLLSLIAILVILSTPSLQKLASRIWLEFLAASFCLCVLVRFDSEGLNSFKVPKFKNLGITRFKYLGITMLSQSSLIVFMSSDRLLIGHLLGLEAVADYTVLLYGMLPTFIISGVISQLSMKVFSDYERTQKVNLDIINYYLLYGIPAFIVLYILYFSLGVPLLQFLIPVNYHTTLSNLPVTVSALLMNYVFLTSTRGHHALRSYKLVFLILLTGTMINVITLIALSESFGYLSGIISTILAYLVMTFLSLIFIMWKNEMNKLNVFLNLIYMIVGFSIMIGMIIK